MAPIGKPIKEWELPAPLDVPTKAPKELPAPKPEKVPA
jgi:hypothetical protein